MTLTKLPPNAQALSLTLFASGAVTDKMPSTSPVARIAMALTGGMAANSRFNNARSFETLFMPKPDLCEAISMPETVPKLPLDQWTILSLRPQGQHAATYRAAKNLGAFFLPCSSMKLVACDDRGMLEKALLCERIIVTSPAAARFAAQSPLFTLGKNAQWFALGPGTAAVLQEHGMPRIITPAQGHDSEALLAIPELQNIQAKSIGLMTAPGGRGLIEPELIKRGAKLEVAHVYQRKTIRLKPLEIRRLEQLHLPFAVLCSSHEVFASFWQQISPALREKLKSGQWILTSKRLQGLLEAAGIGNSSISESARPDAMLAQLVYVQTQQVR